MLEIKFKEKICFSHFMLPKYLPLICILHSFLGRGFDQETFSEKDEGAICSYNTRSKGNARKDGIWDIFHPNVFNPRGNAGTVLLGR